MLAIDQLDQYFRVLEAQDKYSGVVLITQGAQQLYAGAFGYASRDWQIKNTLETRFDTASITKLFTAVAILQLIDQGLLSLETRVIPLLGLKDTAISDAVNVYHLLTHTSGIADDADEEAGERYEDIWIDKPNYSVRQTVDFIPQCTQKPPNFAPGEGCRYCNCGFVLLGLVLEQISGLGYREYVQKHIFEPTGMTASGFFHKDQVQSNVAEGSDPILDMEGKIIGWKKNIYSFPPIGSPDGGAYVTAADLDRFLRSVQAGKLLSPPLTAAFLSSHVHYRNREQGTLRIGYALEFFVDTAGNVEFYEKEGVNVGVSAILRYIPAQDINIILLSNMENGVWKPIKKVHEVVTS